MKERRFFIVLMIVLGICLALTIVHMIYVITAYQQCSIIYFIGKELW